MTAEHLDLVAGAVRGRGQMTLALDGARPRLTGRFAAEVLPLPALPLRGRQPLGLDRLAALEAELALEVARVEAAGEPVLEAVTTALKLAGGTLRLDGLQARLGGGTLKGTLAVDGAAAPPRLSLDAALADAIISGPLFDLPLDLGAGRVEGTARLTAEGHSMAAILATLAGRRASRRATACWWASTWRRCRRPARCPSCARPKRRCARPWPAARRPSSGWRAGRGWRPAARCWRGCG
ncbi:hypothetical protein [Dankookia sp. P2]|uniref:hypothetical protein n=1 Tax=Dankookia sp. P2 TaxID=3423955 RepID=UPI003D675B66